MEGRWALVVQAIGAEMSGVTLVALVILDTGSLESGARPFLVVLCLGPPLPSRIGWGFWHSPRDYGRGCCNCKCKGQPTENWVDPKGVDCDCCGSQRQGE